MTKIKQLQPKEGVTLLAVKVPEGATGYTVIGGKIIFDIQHGLNNNRFDLPEGNWQPLGISTEIPEEVWQRIIERIEVPFDEGTFCYPDFAVYGKTGFKAFDTATEAAMSFLEANEVYSENPYGNYLQCLAVGSYYGVTYYQWQKAEANTGTWVILVSPSLI